METITKKTSSMWKYIDIPKEPEPHTEYDSQYAVLPGGKVVGARVRGKKHKHDGSNCDDWFEIGFVDEWTTITVSDGAGSKKLSRIGAEVSAKAVSNYLMLTLAEFADYKTHLIEALSLPVTDPEYTKTAGYLANIIHNAVNEGYNAVKKALEERKKDEKICKFLGREPQLSDFSATLITAVILPVNEQETLIATCQIGDGAVFAVDSKSPFSAASRVLTEADSGEFAGQTEFLTYEKFRRNAELMSRTRIYRGTADTVMVMTDGVSDDYFPYEQGSKQLYLDLTANMIIANRKRLTKNDFDLARTIPRPVTYPWVNDSKVKVSLQYSNRISENMNRPLDFLWDNIGLLSYYTRYVTTSQVKDKGERLLTWLDNYVERGSFDDRTLVIYEK